jgi:hypothetical protein
MGALQRVHCRFCEQTYLSDNLACCSLCGKTGGLVDPATIPAETDLVRQDLEEPALMSGSRSLVDTFLQARIRRISLQCAIVGFGLIGAGVWLLCKSSFQGDTTESTLGYLSAGLGVIAAVSGVLGLLLVQDRPANKCSAVDGERQASTKRADEG